MSKIKYFFEQSWLLIATSFVFGLLLAATDAALAPRIAFNERQKLTTLMSSLLPEAAEFRIAIPQAEITTGKGQRTTTDVYAAVDAQGRSLGYAFVGAGPGFQDQIKLVIAMDADAEKFLGYRVLASNETPNFGSRITEDDFRGQFASAPTETLELVKTGEVEAIDAKIVAISGATISSQAVVNIFNSYTQGIKEQLRTEGLISDGR